jgi:hypothetical protein
LLIISADRFRPGLLIISADRFCPGLLTISALAPVTRLRRGLMTVPASAC